MSNPAHDSEYELSLDERMSIISNYPLFSELRPNDIKELAKLCKEQHVGPGVIIVNEGAPTDSIYLIASGAAEVTRAVTTIGQDRILNIATLGKGDAIGLSQEGFFSQTGARTGTVMSVLSMILLVIDLQDFYHFLQKASFNSLVLKNLKNTCENILLINFIKKTHIFSHLTKEQLEKLIEGKRKISVSLGTVIFKEGDRADNCYFVLSGKIAITAKGVRLAILESSSIFGEGAFISAEKRNADASAVVDSELFVLDKMQIKMISSKMLTQELDVRRIQQLRPTPHPEVYILQNKTSENEQTIILNNPANDAQLQLSQSDYVIWKNLDGKTNLESILKNNPVELNNMHIQDIYARIVVMANSGFLDIKKETFLDKLIKRIKLAW